MVMLGMQEAMHTGGTMKQHRGTLETVGTGKTGDSRHTGDTRESRHRGVTGDSRHRG